MVRKLIANAAIGASRSQALAWERPAGPVLPDWVEAAPPRPSVATRRLVTSSSRASVHAGHRAFSVVELLVAIAIIGVLVALVLPAVQHARERSRRAQCMNNLKQIGLAFQAHEQAHGVVPHNGGWDGQQTIRAVDGRVFTPSTDDFALGQTFQWGVGDPVRPPHRQTGSWLYAMLPFAEQQQVHADRTWMAPVATYICPSRRSAKAYEVVAQDQYGVYEGGGWTWGKTDYAGNAFLIPGTTGSPARRCRSLSSITDGLSSTILAGEKAIDPQVQTDTTWYWDEPFFLGGSAGTARRGIALMGDAVGNDYKGNWGAAHPGGAQFVFGDGSVHIVPYEISWKAFTALLTPAAGDTAPSL